MKKLIMLITFFLCACGGGGLEPRPPSTPTLLKALVHPSDSFVSGAGYDVQISTTDIPDVATNVAHQANNLPDGSVLFGGRTNAYGFGNWPLLLSESLKYPGKFKYAYVYDEIFLGPGKGTEDPYTAGYNEIAMNNAADQARAAGLKTIITALPHTIMHPDFSMTAINKYDVIAIDIYVDWAPVNTYGDNYGTNPYSNSLYAAARKLRTKGFTGDIWYIYQAFGIRGADEALFIAKLELQRETIRDALILGAVGVAPFGMYLGAPELAAEPNLRPLGGTSLEYLVRP